MQYALCQIHIYLMVAACHYKIIDDLMKKNAMCNRTANFVTNIA